LYSPIAQQALNSDFALALKLPVVIVVKDELGAGKSHNIYTPINAVLTIYAGENGEGMFFEKDQMLPKKEKKPILTILD
jgi:stringent starvation protein B